MTGLAGCREICTGVIGIGCRLKIAQMARDAVGREALKLADRRALVALIAGNRRVRPEEWEPVLVIPELLRGDLPPQHGVATRAVRAHLALMHVGVTILAVLTDLRENRLDVALCAFHFFVHAAQRILCFGVIEFDDTPDRTPARGGMAVLTRNVQRAVRALGGLPLRCGWRSRYCVRDREQEQTKPAQGLDEPEFGQHRTPRLPP